MISALEASKWSQIAFCILTNILNSISKRFGPNFEQIIYRHFPNGVGYYSGFHTNWKNLTKEGQKYLYLEIYSWGYSQKNWVGVCGSLPKPLTLFMTEFCDIPNRIYDLTKIPKPYLCLDPYIKTLFWTCVIISSLASSDQC